MLVYYFVPFIVGNCYLLFWVSNGHNSVTVQNQTHVYMNFFDHRDLGNHLLQLCPKVVKHPVYVHYMVVGGIGIIDYRRPQFKNHYVVSLSVLHCPLYFAPFSRFIHLWWTFYVLVKQESCFLTFGSISDNILLCCPNSCTVWVLAIQQNPWGVLGRVVDALSKYMELISMEKQLNQKYHMTLVAVLINWKS